MNITLRNNNSYSPAELLNDQQMLLSGVFFEDNILILTNEYLHDLQKIFHAPKSVLFSYNKKRMNPFMHPDFSTCTHVNVRLDRVTKPPTSPYEGPYNVIR